MDDDVKKDCSDEADAVRVGCLITLAGSLLVGQVAELFIWDWSKNSCCWGCEWRCWLESIDAVRVGVLLKYELKKITSLSSFFFSLL